MLLRSLPICHVGEENRQQRASTDTNGVVGSHVSLMIAEVLDFAGSDRERLEERTRSKLRPSVSKNMVLLTHNDKGDISISASTLPSWPYLVPQVSLWEGDPPRG